MMVSVFHQHVKERHRLRKLRRPSHLIVYHVLPINLHQGLRQLCFKAVQSDGFTAAVTQTCVGCVPLAYPKHHRSTIGTHPKSSMREKT